MPEELMIATRILRSAMDQPAGTPRETPNQHLRNALGILTGVQPVGSDREGLLFRITESQLMDVFRRVWTAVKLLER